MENQIHAAESGDNGVLEPVDFVGACPLLVVLVLFVLFGSRYVRRGRDVVEQPSLLERAVRELEADLPADARTGWEDPHDRERL